MHQDTIDYVTVSPKLCIHSHFIDCQILVALMLGTVIDNNKLGYIICLTIT
jgi:hypothetical protein